MMPKMYRNTVKNKSQYSQIFCWGQYAPSKKAYKKSELNPMTHREIFSYSCLIIDLDCSYHIPIDLAPNRIQFSLKMNQKIIITIKIWTRLKTNFSACSSTIFYCMQWKTKETTLNNNIYYFNFLENIFVEYYSRLHTKF